MVFEYYLHSFTLLLGTLGSSLRQKSIPSAYSGETWAQPCAATWTTPGIFIHLILTWPVRSNPLFVHDLSNNIKGEKWWIPMSSSLLPAPFKPHTNLEKTGLCSEEIRRGGGQGQARRSSVQLVPVRLLCLMFTMAPSTHSSPKAIGGGRDGTRNQQHARIRSQDTVT